MMEMEWATDTGKIMPDCLIFLSLNIEQQSDVIQDNSMSHSCILAVSNLFVSLFILLAPIPD